MKPKPGEYEKARLVKKLREALGQAGRPEVACRGNARNRNAR